MQFRNVFQFNHLFENRIIKRDYNEVFALIYFSEQLSKIERNALLSKMLKASAMTIEGDKDDIFSEFAFFKNIRCV